ncbi:MAG TPA: 5'-methylthioadenosine/adenosylhomocysteine nucleosidase [Methanocorpusculum sp.]|nr:5'-methylthioadenosine/adenosylhomocysteine nucleosidase [Methanocorpusculum sp.]
MDKGKLLSVACALFAVLVFALCAGCIAAPDTAAVQNEKLIGFVGATGEETAYLLSAMENKEEKTIGIMKFTKGTIDGIACVIGECGIGKIYAAACTQAMIDSYHPACIVNIGVGGAISADLHVGDLVIAENTVIHDFNLTPIGNAPGQLWENKLIYIPCNETLVNKVKQAAETLGIRTVTGISATGDQFIEDPEVKLSLEKDFNALVCDMEGAAVALVCYENNVPCVICRTISDARNGNGSDYTENVGKTGYDAAKLGEELLHCLA